MKYSFLGIMAYVMNILYIKTLNKPICEFLFDLTVGFVFQTVSKIFDTTYTINCYKVSLPLILIFGFWVVCFLPPHQVITEFVAKGVIIIIAQLQMKNYVSYSQNPWKTSSWNFIFIIGLEYLQIKSSVIGAFIKQSDYSVHEREKQSKGGKLVLLQFSFLLFMSVT